MTDKEANVIRRVLSAMGRRGGLAKAAKMTPEQKKQVGAMLAAARAAKKLAKKNAGEK